MERPCIWRYLLHTMRWRAPLYGIASKVTELKLRKPLIIGSRNCITIIKAGRVGVVDAGQYLNRCVSERSHKSYQH